MEDTSIETYKQEKPCPELLEFLSSAYEVLRKVFSYLDLEDLTNAGEAFESWKPVAEVTKKERLIIESFVLSEIKYTMTPIWSEGVFCIAFCTASNKELEEKVTRFMSPNSEVLLCLSYRGVIGTLNDLSHLVQQNIRVGLPLAPKKFYFSAVRFPNLPNTGIKTFTWEENDDFQVFKDNFQIPENSIIKCLLIFVVSDEGSRAASKQKEDFILFLQKRQKECFAVGGCIVDDFENYKRKSSANSIIKYIVFYGDNVEAASTVLTSDVKTIPNIDFKVSELKRVGPKTKKGVMFVFRCAGRQRVLRRLKYKNDIMKWEGEAIKKHFPQTPIVGCMGYGEFGNEHPQESNASSPKKRFRSCETWEYSFSTSLVYVGFKSNAMYINLELKLNRTDN